jgi:hypothetical protein
MTEFLLIIQVVSQLLPLVTGLVQGVEAAFPNTPGSGKLSAVQSLIQSAFDKLGAIGVTFEQVWPTISAFVSATVAIYNASGLFKHASTAVNTIAGDIQTGGAAVLQLATTEVTALQVSPAPAPTPAATAASIAGPFAQAASSLNSATSAASSSQATSQVNS